ncbi:MAG: AraC family transcriptional regulator [Ruminococcus sp.]|nr:AraC family transcriptional regulator [Ruminococcus sp.]
MNDSPMTSHLFAHREDGFRYAPFDREVAFYESICSGNIELVKMFAAPLFCEGCGTLSKDYLRNLKYHFTITTALIARFCVNSGMTPEEAYSLSDIYIMKADECMEENELRCIHADMIEDYTRKMRRVRTGNVYSKRIVCAMDYISEHLHSSIRIEETAEYLQINPAYLSRAFKAETGMTFTDYVNRKKVEEAAGLLSYSKYSDLEISSLLCFSSQSYFIKIFKKYIGITPKEYKKKYRFND